MVTDKVIFYSHYILSCPPVSFLTLSLLSQTNEMYHYLSKLLNVFGFGHCWNFGNISTQFKKVYHQGLLYISAQADTV